MRTNASLLARLRSDHSRRLWLLDRNINGPNPNGTYIERESESLALLSEVIAREEEKSDAQVHALDPSLHLFDLDLKREVYFPELINDVFEERQFNKKINGTKLQISMRHVGDPLFEDHMPTRHLKLIRQ